MSSATYVQFLAIPNHYIQAAKDVDQSKIEAFFRSNEFFSNHPKLEFFLGELEGRRHLLITVDSAMSIHAEIKDRFSPHFSPPVGKSGYAAMERVDITSGVIFNKILNDIKKYNKTLRANQKLQSLKESFEKARKMYREKKYLFIAVDIESFERDHSCILEIGWSMMNAKADPQVFMDRHMCVKEYRHLKNGNFVPDMKDRFTFGTTAWAGIKEIGEEFKKDLKELDDVVIVGHDIEMEIKYLQTMGIDVKNAIKPAAMFDTATMYAACMEKPHERTNLGKLCDNLGIENYALHNAGNDAHYTLLAFLEMCKLDTPFKDNT